MSTPTPASVQYAMQRPANKRHLRTIPTVEQPENAKYRKVWECRKGSERGKFYTKAEAVAFGGLIRDYMEQIKQSKS